MTNFEVKLYTVTRQRSFFFKHNLVYNLTVLKVGAFCQIGECNGSGQPGHSLDFWVIFGHIEYMPTLIKSTVDYRNKQALTTHLNWQKGVYNRIIKKELRNCLNKNCDNSFIVPPSDKQKYCSQDCWYLVRRDYRLKISRPCITCRKLVTQKGASKYCSLKCQFNNNYTEYIQRWQEGIESGSVGITTRSISGHIKRYLREKYKQKCSICGWDKKHPITGRVPLEVDHIDGNSENNTEENLRIICPNCHSLTSSFRNLNKGHGRTWRKTYMLNHTQFNPKLN